jgi:uncharacterized membrane protein HdeD (DUF308 family)
MNLKRSTWTGAFARQAKQAYPDEYRRGRWPVLLIVGLLQVAAGFFAMLMPRLASVTAAVIFGAALMLLSFAQIAHGLTDRALPGYSLRILSGLLYMAVGALMVLYPVPGAFTLTIFVALAFIIEGALRAGFAIWLRPPPRWGLQTVSGLIGLTIGVTLLVGWPVAGVWVLGVLLGVNLLISGSVYCAIAFAVRASRRQQRLTRGD